MNRRYLFLALYSLAAFIIASSLIFLGERRLDVYLSLYILNYFIMVSIFDPKIKYRSFLNIVLFIIFILIVVFRVAEILGWKI